MYVATLRHGMHILVASLSMYTYHTTYNVQWMCIHTSYQECIRTSNLILATLTKRLISTVLAGKSVQFWILLSYSSHPFLCALVIYIYTMCIRIHIYTKVHTHTTHLHTHHTHHTHTHPPTHSPHSPHTHTHLPTHSPHSPHTHTHPPTHSPHTYPSTYTLTESTRSLQRARRFFFFQSVRRKMRGRSSTDCFRKTVKRERCPTSSDHV